MQGEKAVNVPTIKFTLFLLAKSFSLIALSIFKVNGFSTKTGFLFSIIFFAIS